MHKFVKVVAVRKGLVIVEDTFREDLKRDRQLIEADVMRRVGAVCAIDGVELIFTPA